MPPPWRTIPFSSISARLLDTSAMGRSTCRASSSTWTGLRLRCCNSNASVSVDIRHTWKGDLKVDLVAPDGSIYNIHNRSGGSADNVIGTYTLNLSSEALNGTWRLRVNDNARGDTGYINSWSVTF